MKNQKLSFSNTQQLAAIIMANTNFHSTKGIYVEGESLVVEELKARDGTGLPAASIFIDWRNFDFQSVYGPIMYHSGDYRRSDIRKYLEQDGDKTVELRTRYALDLAFIGPVIFKGVPLSCQSYFEPQNLPKKSY